MARKPVRPGRTLLVFFSVVAVLFGLVAIGGTWKPALGLDLKGGTRITLIATDDPRHPSVTEAELIALVEHSPLTFTAVPVASGERIALDRDSDGKLDGSDLDDSHDWDWTWDLDWTWDD